jgi:hypothetical protein
MRISVLDLASFPTEKVLAVVTIPPAQQGGISHGGYPMPSGTSTIAGGSVNGTTGAAPVTINVSGSIFTSVPTGTWVIGNGNGTPIALDKVKVNTIDDYSFFFKENNIERRAVLAPEYDITPLESMKLVRLMYSAPNNLDHLQYVKDNALLRHFRLE